MDFVAVKTFIAVVEHGSLTAASRNMNYAQSTLSHHVSVLERTLGVLLFSRRPDGLKLTTAGEPLLPHALLLVATRDRAIYEVRSAEVPSE